MGEHEADRERRKAAESPSLPPPGDLVELGQRRRGQVSSSRSLIGALPGARAVDAEAVRLLVLGQNPHVRDRGTPGPVRRSGRHKPARHSRAADPVPANGADRTSIGRWPPDGQGMGHRSGRPRSSMSSLVHHGSEPTGIAGAQHRHARRRADRRGRIGSSRTATPRRGQLLQVRRLGGGIAVAAGDPLRVLIGENEKNIRTPVAHRRYPSKPIDRRMATSRWCATAAAAASPSPATRAAMVARCCSTPCRRRSKV